MDFGLRLYVTRSKKAFLWTSGLSSDGVYYRYIWLTGEYVCMILDPIWSLIAFDIGVDLGTANTVVYVKGSGVVSREPTVLARHKKTKAVVAVGQAAKDMIGKTPASIQTVSPVTDGVVEDFEAAQALIKAIIETVHRNVQRKKLPRPRVIVGVPSLVTEVERKSVVDAAKKAGAREVILVDEAIASALGSGLLTGEAKGRLLIDIGGGTTEMAIVSLDGLVLNRSVPVGGWEMDQAIMAMAREKYHILIGEQTAEYLKIQVGQAMEVKDKRSAMLRGRDLVSGLPKAVRVSGDEVEKAIKPIVEQLRMLAHELLEETPPELAADISEAGVTLTGGGAMLAGLDTYLSEALKMPVVIAEDPLSSVVLGTAKMLEDKKLLEKYRLEV